MAQKEINIEPQPSINYASVPDAIAAWRQDRLGEKTFQFLSNAYGIADVPSLLAKAGMGDYLRYKQEGRFIGLVASQILKPSFYYLAGAVVLGELAKNGVPSALMVFEYPQDIFDTRNVDKVKSFGQQRFWLDRNEVRLKINPVDASINQLGGTACNQILARVVEAVGPDNQPYFYKERGNLSAALGFGLPEKFILTDFYKRLWLESIDRLRRNGILPNESILPMFFVDMVKLYSTIAQAAQRAPSEIQLNRRGMMTSASYYPLQVAWPDLYIECSSHASPDFIASAARAQQVRYQHGLPEVQVRLPHERVPELENLCLHPSGKIADLSSIWKSRNSELKQLADQKRWPEIKQITQERDQAYFAALDGHLADYWTEQAVSFPSSVEAVYQSIIKGEVL